MGGELRPLCRPILNPSPIQFHLSHAAYVVPGDSRVLHTFKGEGNCSSEAVNRIVAVFTCMPLAMAPEVFDVI